MKKDIQIGMRHGHLTVVGSLGTRKGHKLFECKCDCGETVTLRGSHFYPGREFCTRSCVLLSQHRTREMVSGRRFGKWTIVDRGTDVILGGKPRATWVCDCDCGTRRSVSGEMLRSGNSASCGCSLNSWSRRENNDFCLASLENSPSSIGFCGTVAFRFPFASRAACACTAERPNSAPWPSFSSPALSVMSGRNNCYW